MIKIISGGQTGVDRAALDTAARLGLPRGGWCPRGGWAEDHPTPPGLLSAYPELQETPSTEPQQRTAWNVRDSDRTLILVDQRGLDASPGTALTRDLAMREGRPCLVAALVDEAGVSEAAAWIAAGGDNLVLNIAGPRESEAPGIYDAARAWLERVLAKLPRG